MPDSFTFQRESTTTFLGKTNKNTFIYTAVAGEPFRIADISHGGYNMGLILDSAINHFSNRHQTDPVALNCFFLNKTSPGHLLIELEHVKMSTKGYCVVRATLKQTQDLSPLTSIDHYTPTDWTDKVLAVITMGNFDAENGLTLYPSTLSVDTTGFEPYDLKFLMGVVEFQMRKTSLTKINTDDVTLPVVQHIGHFRDGESLSFQSIPFWADIFFQPPILFPNDTLESPVWCPTMQLEVLFKQKPSGKSLFSQFVTHHTINGRFDIMAELWNEKGQVLAVASHQCLIVPWARNSKDSGISYKNTKSNL